MNKYAITGIDYGANIEFCRQNHTNHLWLNVNLEDRTNYPEWNIPYLKKAGVICADVIEHLINPEPLLEELRSMQKYTPLMILTTPDRRKLGSRELGMPTNQHHVREWTLEEFTKLLKSYKIKYDWIDYTVTDTARGNAFETITMIKGYV